MAVHSLIAAGSALALVLAFAAGMALASFPADVATALASDPSYIYLATRRADGARSSVKPVWFTVLDGAIYFTTEPHGWKAKRIRRGSPLWVWIGSPEGPHFEGKAEILSDTALATRMGEAYNRKYWIAWLGLFLPRASRVESGKTVIVRVTPAAG